jgi:hypothetical protein
MVSPVTLALALALAQAPGLAPAAPGLPDLVARARELKLAEDPAWLRLGHYRRGPLGWKSEADGPSFFNSAGGRRDPAAELEATVAALVDSAPPTDPDAAPACRFPARLRWLRERLGLDEARLPPRPCPKLQAFRDRVTPVGVTVVFSSYYLNNPASSFGHTLLRLNKGEARGTERAELLDYGISYAASAGPDNAVVYALKGLFGGYRGEFTHFAYYYKVREYSDAESRDLWEYDLALVPGEVAMLVDHLWELANTWFDYWYLDENCSYHVLTALEAAAPRLDLASRAGWPLVLPSETVKALFENPGLVTAVHYRPSVLTQFRARTSPLSPAALDAVEALADDDAAPLPEALGPERAAILDAALDHLDLWAFKDLVLEKDPAAARRRQLLLERRAALGIPSAPLRIPPPLERAPERGHGGLRLGAGGGAASEAGPLVLLEGRLALHDLLDPPAGYPEVAHIQFLPTRLRWETRPGRLRLDEAWLIDVISLNDVGRFDQRPSWRFRVGAEAVRDAAGPGMVAFSAGAGGGLASLRVLGVADALATADVEVQAAAGLSGLAGSGWRVGLGPTALLRLKAGDRAALLLDGAWRWLPDASPGETWRYGAEGRLHLGRGWSLALRARRAPSEDAVTAALHAFL